jgi:hypothetical protein
MRSVPRLARRPAVLGAVVALVLGCACGDAWAYFTSSGSGSAAASVGAAQAVTVLSATGTPSSTLSPGHSADLTLTVTNPNTVTVTLVRIAQNGAPTVVDGGSTCTASSSGVQVPAQGDLDIPLPHGTDVVHVPAGATMTLTSANGCQGASFRIPVTITVEER